MRRKRSKRNKNISAKLGLLFIVLILSLASISASYAHWEDELEIDAEMTTGTWNSCIKIRKTVDKGCPISDFCEKYYMTIEVMNNGSNDLTNVNVTDKLGAKVTKTDYSQSTGIVYWSGRDFRWDIGDLAAGETETLIICFTVNFGCCNYVSAYVEDPDETAGSTHPIKRITETGDEITVYYKVVHEYNHRAVKFESCKYANGEKANLGEDGMVETDTFVINVSGGVEAVRVKTKAGQKWGYSNLIGIGDTTVDANGFTITLVNVTDIEGGQKQYTFTVTSDNVPGGDCGTKALSNIKFDFGEICTIKINDGAKVTAKSIWCDLEATTDKLNIYKCRFSKNCPEWVYEILYSYETPWAWNCCDYICCDDC